MTGLVAIVVHYGDPAPTARAIRSIAAGTSRVDHLCVVDNGPEPLGDDALDVRLDAEILRPGSNLGFARAVNLAVLEHPEADAYWLLNNDAVARPTALEQLRQVADREGDRSIVASLVWDPAANEIWFAGARFLPWLLESRHRSVARIGDAPVVWSRPGTWHSVPYLSGCSLYVPARYRDATGVLDARAFLYGEDVELSMRVLEAGGRLVLAPASVVDHDLTAPTSEAFRQRRQSEEALRIVMREYPWLTPLSVSAGLAAGFARTLRDRDVMWTVERARGYWARLRGNDSPD